MEQKKFQIQKINKQMVCGIFRLEKEKENNNNKNCDVSGFWNLRHQSTGYNS